MFKTFQYIIEQVVLVKTSSKSMFTILSKNCTIFKKIKQKTRLRPATLTDH